MNTIRKPVIMGNWKMNLSLKEASLLADRLRMALPWPGRAEVVLAPGFVHLRDIAQRLADSYIAVAAQDLHPNDNGAFTGDTAGPALREAGAHYAIIGHSERRAFYNETNALINSKITAAFRNSLIPVVCVGETLEERQSATWDATLRHQISTALEKLPPENAAYILWAYEPVWAIGTGKSAQPAQVSEAHALIRQCLSHLYSPSLANSTRILYGGSVNAANAPELLALPDVDGALVGSASLNADQFIAIVRAAG